MISLVHPTPLLEFWLETPSTPLTLANELGRLSIVCNPSIDAHSVMKCVIWFSIISWQGDCQAVVPSAKSRWLKS